MTRSAVMRTAAIGLGLALAGCGVGATRTGSDAVPAAATLPTLPGTGYSVEYDSTGYLVHPVWVTPENTGDDPAAIVGLLEDNLRYAMRYDDEQWIFDLFGGESSKVAASLLDVASAVESQRVANAWDTPEKRAEIPFEVTFTAVSELPDDGVSGFGIDARLIFQERFGGHAFQAGTDQLLHCIVIDTATETSRIYTLYGCRGFNGD